MQPPSSQGLTEQQRLCHARFIQRHPLFLFNTLYSLGFLAMSVVTAIWN